MVAYFYFDFNDSDKQTCNNLIRSLIKQLSMQNIGIPKSLKDLYTSKQDGQQEPSLAELLKTLEEIAVGFSESYIILDALDECAEKEKEELLGLIKEITRWERGKPHILVTSRREKDIEDELEPLCTASFDLETAPVDADIQLHVCEELDRHRKLQKLPTDLKEEIKEKLTTQAHGM